MNRLRYIVTLSAFACYVAGCGDSALNRSLGGSLEGGISVSSEDGSSVAVMFEEDAEPAIAALSFVADEILVQSYPGADAASVAELYEEVGVVVVKRLDDIDVDVLRVDASAFDATAASLAESGLLEIVQKNYLYEPSAVPDDIHFPRQRHLTQSRVDRAWDTTIGSEDVIIAIVDTGVDPEHPDLSEKIVDGWNVVENSADFSDVNGHGTMVAGVAAAMSDNRRGVAGVAWESPIVAVRVTDSDGGTSAGNLAAGILWAAERGARVINVSFAPLWSNRVVRAAAQQAYHRGSLVVISAGNAGGTTSAAGFTEGFFVGAVSSSDQIARFSDRGPFVDLSAPGVGVLTTELGGDYVGASGTSFAAPLVSGVAALAWSMRLELRPISIQEAILDTSREAGDAGKDDVYGWGTVDAAAAVLAAEGSIIETDTTAPKVAVSRPRDGSTYSGRFTASVKATDRWGVADVVMSIDGVPRATDTRSPYRFVIDPALYASGRHELSFVATDDSGNASGPGEVTVTFGSSGSRRGADASEIGFRSPQSGSTVSGNVSIEATVSDSDGLAAVEWFVDGVAVLATAVSGTQTSVSYYWRSAGAPSGEHTISLVVTDADGNQTTKSLGVVRK